MLSINYSLYRKDFLLITVLLIFKLGIVVVKRGYILASNIPGGGSPSALPPPLPDTMPTPEQAVRFLSDSRDLMQQMLTLIKGMPEHTISDTNLKRRLVLQVKRIVMDLVSCVTPDGVVTANKQKTFDIAGDAGRLADLVCTVLERRHVTQL